jgi:hypothetical protein|tara:strand:+ start:1102 stop:1281 length:180 start_codon:yes stop_codon:yes gene_type:complete
MKIYDVDGDFMDIDDELSVDKELGISLRWDAFEKEVMCVFGMDDIIKIRDHINSLIGGK